MKELTAQDFQAELHRVEIPEKNGVVYIQEPSADFIIDLIGSQDPEDPQIDVKAILPKLIATCVVDKDGHPLFTEKNQPSGVTYLRVMNAVLEHSGLKDFEQQVKNSSAALSNDSATA